MISNQDSLPTVEVQPVVYQVIFEGHLRRLPISKARHIKPGMLICFESWSDDVPFDRDCFVYAVVERISFHSDALNVVERNFYDLVHFQPILSLEDVVIS